MTQNTFFADEHATDPQAAAGLATQMLAFASAACVGAGVLLGSLALGIALFAIVLVTMNIEAGSGWVATIRRRLARRNHRLRRHLLSPQ